VTFCVWLALLEAVPPSFGSLYDVTLCWRRWRGARAVDIDVRSNFARVAVYFVRWTPDCLIVHIPELKTTL